MVIRENGIDSTYLRRVIDDMKMHYNVDPRRIYIDGVSAGGHNADGENDLSDAIFTLGCLFLGTACPTCDDDADSNHDGALDLSDAVYSLGFLFLGGPSPADPGPTTCGVDPTDDALDCAGDDPCFGS
jgi:hypothetical protein